MGIVFAVPSSLKTHFLNYLENYDILILLINSLPSLLYLIVQISQRQTIRNRYATNDKR